jgi:hypothetical protein
LTWPFARNRPLLCHLLNSLESTSFRKGRGQLPESFESHGEGGAVVLSNPGGGDLVRSSRGLWTDLGASPAGESHTGVLSDVRVPRVRQGPVPSPPEECLKEGRLVLIPTGVTQAPGELWLNSCRCRGPVRVSWNTSLNWSEGLAQSSEEEELWSWSGS